jgi:hypothetical protein
MTIARMLADDFLGRICERYEEPLPGELSNRISRDQIGPNTFELMRRIAAKIWAVK